MTKAFHEATQTDRTLPGMLVQRYEARKSIALSLRSMIPGSRLALLTPLSSWMAYVVAAILSAFVTSRNTTAASRKLTICSRNTVASIAHRRLQCPKLPRIILEWTCCGRDVLAVGKTHLLISSERDVAARRIDPDVGQGSAIVGRLADAGRGSGQPRQYARDSDFFRQMG